MLDQLARFRSNLADIADAYAALAAQHHAAATGSKGVRVAGSTEPKLPIAIDPVDLTGEARHGSLDVADTSPWPEDQIGHLAIATELDFWVRDIAAMQGDTVPVPVVPVLAMWLHERAGWAWDYYGALDEMVVTVERLARTLHAVTNPRRPRAEPKAAPCPGCGEATLSGDGERVTCSMEDCGRILTEPEYTEWSRLVVVREALDGWGISAREIAFVSGKPIGTVHRWAAEFAWTRTGKERRPVLYCKAQVDVSLAKIAAREAKAKAEQKARAA